MTLMKHTKSPSGKTHRLTDRKGESVTLRYRERPQFDDQVQGDLVRAYRTKTGDPSPIGIIPVHVDAALLDNGQQQPSVDYLRGYLNGLEADRFGRSMAIQKTREQIARLEAAQRGYATAPVNVGTGGAISGIPPQGPPPAAGAVSIHEERPQTDRDRHRTQGYSGIAAAEHQRRMREQRS